jgi:hypothetical protein
MRFRFTAALVEPAAAEPRDLLERGAGDAAVLLRPVEGG